MAMYAGISQVFLAAGPLLGGLLTEWVSWRAVFWLNVPVGIAALVMVHVAKPGQPRAHAGDGSARQISRCSPSGSGRSSSACSRPTPGAGDRRWTLGSIVAGLALTAAFCRRQLRSDDPLLNIRLFQRRPFMADSTVMGLLQFALVPIVLYTSLYAQNLLGFSPVIAGVAALAAGAAHHGRGPDRRALVRPGRGAQPVLTGLAIATVGIVARAVALPTLSYWPAVPGMVLMGLGLGLTISPTNTDSLNRVAGAGTRSGVRPGADGSPARRDPRPGHRRRGDPGARRPDPGESSAAHQTARRHGHRLPGRRGRGRRRPGWPVGAIWPAAGRQDEAPMSLPAEPQTSSSRARSIREIP